MLAISDHQSGVRVEIVGIEVRNRGCSCKQHHCCGKVVVLDTVLCLQKVQILNGKEPLLVRFTLVQTAATLTL
jgi:hypothetical protein